MITCGIDIGARTVKVVILLDGRVKAREIRDTGPRPAATAQTALAAALAQADIRAEQLDATVSTGYGRDVVTCADSTATEITCQARGVREILPEARGIIDIGGQDSKAISLDDAGRVLDFAMNDRCAAGTGAFLEVMARVFQMGLDEMSAVAAEAGAVATISSVCTVFAESEVISLLARGKDRDDVLAGAHQTVAGRVAGLARRVHLVSPIALTGGVAKNAAIKNHLEKFLGTSLQVPNEPQFTGALGAAIVAARRAETLSTEGRS